MDVIGIGTYRLDLKGGRTLDLHDVLYAPGIRRNLLSVTSLLSIGYRFCFESQSVHIYHGSVYYASGYLLDGFIFLDVDISSVDDVLESTVSFNASVHASSIDSMRWHSRLGQNGQAS